MRYAVSVLTGTTVSLALLISAGVTSAQTLGDLARKEGERRKTVTPGKVYTNDNLGKAPAPPVSSAATTPASSESTPSSAQGKDADKAGAPGDKAGDKAKTDDVKKDEAYWRSRLQAERDALSRAKVLIEALQGRVSSLQTDFVNRDDPAARAKITAERQTTLAELERMKLEIQQHNQTIADIQEEARRASVPAAWYR